MSKSLNTQHRQKPLYRISLAFERSDPRLKKESSTEGVRGITRAGSESEGSSIIIPADSGGANFPSNSGNSLNTVEHERTLFNSF